jgi:hypothetical protein
MRNFIMYFIQYVMHNKIHVKFLLDGYTENKFLKSVTFSSELRFG